MVLLRDGSLRAVSTSDECCCPMVDAWVLQTVWGTALLAYELPLSGGRKYLGKESER